ncbi:MAG: hypothetical protein KAH48_01200 [Chlorobi bacterium]|nr:hypothetical protein [Chlorobiota bacterium]
MPYKKLKVQKYTEQQFRDLWKNEYCDKSKPIHTFDDILVRFYEDMFDHAFYESYNTKAKDKSILSLNRLQKMLWIKDTLEDPDSIRKKGWDRKRRTYLNSRRVALIKGNYIVVIVFLGENIANFVTAYEIQDDENVAKIMTSPDWIP